MIDASDISWSATSLGKAIEALGRQSGLAVRPVEVSPPPVTVARTGGDPLGQWISATASYLGLEATPDLPLHSEVDTLVNSRATPVLFRLPGLEEPRFIAFLGARKRVASVIAPDLAVRRIPAEDLRAALCRAVEEPLNGEVDRLLNEVGVSARRRKQAQKAILGSRLRRTWVEECWHLRLSPGASVRESARQARLTPRLILLISAHITQYLLWILSWWLIGKAALAGRLDYGWLLAWVLLLLTTIPFRLLATWSGALLAIGAGGLLKQRLLNGALKLQPEETRTEGVGHLLGRVFEGEAVETLALGGGFLGLVAGIELLIGAFVLIAGAAGWLHLLLLAAWTSLTFLLGWRYYHRRLGWTESRLHITHNLVESMVGHRTRLAQESRERWHDGEDRSLENYLDLSRSLDRAAALLVALIPRGWLVVGICGLVFAFSAGGSIELLAVSLGGVLLVYRAFEKLTECLASLAGAGVAWQQVKPLFNAATRSESEGVPALAISQTTSQPADTTTLVEAHALGFRYRESAEPILRDCTLQISRGDRLLLEGPSGGGKSTLASLLTGMRHPNSGLLLLDGLDNQTLGRDGWRRRVVAAPQFHENHVMTESFAFNLLMGRRWPPRPEDLEEAIAVCNELGLGDLLQRMPAGLEQLVGESGWQLSHGERSRLFIARALLQQADLLLLDESFAALDPENLQRALGCVLQRAPTLLVIAHP